MDIYKFNQLYADNNNKELIRKALTSASGQGAGLIKDNYVDVITNTAVRLVPELAVPVLKYDPQKDHVFTRLTSIPAAGSAMGEGSTTPVRNSSFVRDSIAMKVMKRKGAVTGFLQDASINYIDASVAEMESHILSFGNDLSTYFKYGNKGADQYTFDGLDVFISSNRDNLTLGGEVQSNLSLLDAMIDANTRNQGSSHRKVFLVSPEMLSSLSSLWTIVRDTRSATARGTTGVMVEGGYRLETYRGIPFLETTGTRPVSTMGTVSLASAGSGGAIPDDEYFFRVAPVTWDGEQLASAANNSISTTSADTITLSFTAVSNALFYKVYCGATLNNETLVKVVSAFNYGSDGTVSSNVTSIVFSSNPLTADTISAPSHMQNDIPLQASGSYDQPAETIILWDLDEYQGMGKVAYTNRGGSQFRGLITPMELAQTDDNYPFLLKSYAALIPAFEKTSYMVRGVRTK